MWSQSQQASTALRLVLFHSGNPSLSSQLGFKANMHHYSLCAINQTTPNEVDNDEAKPIVIYNYVSWQHLKVMTHLNITDGG